MVSCGLLPRQNQASEQAWPGPASLDASLVLDTCYGQTCWHSTRDLQFETSLCHLSCLFYINGGALISRAYWNYSSYCVCRRPAEGTVCIPSVFACSLIPVPLPGHCAVITALSTALSCAGTL